MSLKNRYEVDGAAGGRERERGGRRSRGHLYLIKGQNSSIRFRWLLRLVASFAVLIGSFVLFFTDGGVAGASPPEPTPSCTFTSTFVPADGQPFGDDYALAQAFPTYANETSDPGATFDFSCTGIEAPEVDFVTPYGGGYVVLMVQSADLYGAGPSYANLPSTLDVTQATGFTTSDADPSAFGGLAIVWYPTLNDAENFWNGYVVESPGVNEWDTLDQGLAYTDGVYTDLYGDGGGAVVTTGLVQSAFGSVAEALAAWFGVAIALVLLAVGLGVGAKFLVRWVRLAFGRAS